MGQQLTANFATGGGGEGSLPAPPTMGESAEDLFFYEKEAVTLAKGERGLYPILNEVLSRSVICTDGRFRTRPKKRAVMVPLRESRRGSGLAFDRAHEQRHDALDDRAPALMMSNGKPLAQDTLAYTAPGARGEVKLTIATDVAVERTETEVDESPATSNVRLLRTTP